MKMKGKKWIVAGLLAGVAALVLACGSPAASSGGTAAGDFAKNADGYSDITVEQLASLLDSNRDLTLVNVHVPYQGEIADTDLFIPYDQIGAHLDDLPEKSALIVLYCRSGSMSTTAAEELAAAGYANVLEVDGGFNAWKAAGYELLDKNR
jgi:rhodanese-related sulfurtransferase